MRRTVVGVVLVSFVLALGAGAAARESSKIKVTGAWSRSSPVMAESAAVFMILENTGKQSNALLGASVDPTIATKAELHKTTMTTDGTMKMVPVSKIKLPAGKQVVLKPGDYHVMLSGLQKPFEVGSKIEVTLRFAQGAKRKVMVEVKGEEAMGMGGTTAATAAGQGMSGGDM